MPLLGLLRPLFALIKAVLAPIAFFVIGRKSAEADAAEKALEQVREHGKIEEELGGLSASARRKLLRRWAKD